mgnify:CR=1 FL=1
MERIIYNGGLDFKGKNDFSNEECLEMEKMLQNKIKEFAKELEKKFHLVVDKLRFLGYYKTVMIIITSCK